MTQHGSNRMSIAKVLFAFLAAVLVAFATVVVMSQAADAAGAKPGQVRRSVELTPTAVGKKIAAEGAAEIRAIEAEGLQEFSVDMETIRDATGKSAVPEGTRFKVLITNSAHPGQTFRVGRIVMDKSGHGLLDQTNDRAEFKRGATSLAEGTRPVTKIKRVVVKNAAGDTVLQGSF